MPDGFTGRHDITVERNSELENISAENTKIEKQKRLKRMKQSKTEQSIQEICINYKRYNIHAMRI
jgi:hypothetical protein